MPPLVRPMADCDLNVQAKSSKRRHGTMQRIFLTLATAAAFTVASAATVLAADVAKPVYKAPPPAAPAPYN